MFFPAGFKFTLTKDLYTSWDTQVNEDTLANEI